MRSWYLVLVNSVLIVALLCLARKALIPDERAIRNMHTESIEAIGHLSVLMYQNSDLMMRFSHYTDSHPPGEEVLFCPECTLGKSSFLDTYEESAEDTIPDQTLLGDAQEVRGGIRGIAEGLLIQRQSLSHTLKRLREGRGGIYEKVKDRAADRAASDRYHDFSLFPLAGRRSKKALF